MKNEFLLAFNEVLEEKGLPKEVILQALESAMVSAYRRAVNASTAQEITARVDPETGQVSVFAEKEVVDSVQDTRTEVSIEEALKVDPAAEVGSMVMVDSTPRDFGRVAAQTARQVIQQRIRDAERQSQIAFYSKQLGEIVSGIVQAVNSQALTIGLELRAEGTMLRKDMIPQERFRIHDRVRALVAEVKDSPRGPQILLSRTHRDFLRRLLENEVPEIYHGVVEIRSIAREPGERAKVAVSASQSGIDPVGACVGIRGVRIQAIVRELHDEKIDVIEWNPDAAAFIAKAISPARVSGVYLNEIDGTSGKTATVVVPEDQLSLAIGRDGQNARLAAKLTGWRIDIKSVSEALGDILYRLEQEPELCQAAAISDESREEMSALLAKKAENRPLTPEEYDHMAHFVDRFEKRTARKAVVEEVIPEQAEILQQIRNTIPPSAFEQPILESSLQEHVAIILQEAGFLTTGDLALVMITQPDEVLRLQGIGPRAMSDINRLMDAIDQESKSALAAGEPEATGTLQDTSEDAQPAPAGEVMELPGTGQGTEIGDLPSEAAIEPVATEGTTQVEEEEPSFDKLFSLRPDVIFEEADIESEEEVEATDTTSKKKKKKKKHVEVEYDPDRDTTLVYKKHKRGDDAWNWEL